MKSLHTVAAMLIAASTMLLSCTKDISTDVRQLTSKATKSEGLGSACSETSSHAKDVTYTDAVKELDDPLDYRNSFGYYATLSYSYCSGLLVTRHKNTTITDIFWQCVSKGVFKGTFDPTKPIPYLYSIDYSGIQNDTEHKATSISYIEQPENSGVIYLYTSDSKGHPSDDINIDVWVDPEL